MRYWSAVISVILLVSFMSPALAASQSDANDCNQSGDQDRRIAGCTCIIGGAGETARNRALAYGKRGNVYGDKGDQDRAIADYDAAIRLNPKDADTYYNRGLAYDAKGDYDHAIADFGAAILRDPKSAGPYSNRGNAYDAKGDHDRAITDYDEAIHLDPKLAFAYRNRGISYDAKGDSDRAIANYDEAIRLDPNFAIAYINRGIAYFSRGSLGRAQADFKQASDLAPKSAYAALWLDLAERRNNILSHLAEAATQLDMKAWPAPVIRLFLGELTPTPVLAAADDPDPKTKQRQVCEANFFSSELALLQGSKQEAARLLRIAADDCPSGFGERVAANAELKALDSKP